MAVSNLEKSTSVNGNFKKPLKSTHAEIRIMASLLTLEIHC